MENKMERIMKLGDAFEIISPIRPEATKTNCRKAILEGDIPHRRTSKASRSWIYVRPCDIIKFYQGLEKSVNK